MTLEHDESPLYMQCEPFQNHALRRTVAGLTLACDALGFQQCDTFRDWGDRIRPWRANIVDAGLPPVVQGTQHLLALERALEAVRHDRLQRRIDPAAPQHLIEQKAIIA